MTDEPPSIDALVKEFAALWKSGASPPMGQFLERVTEEEQAVAARRLIAIMVEGRQPVSSSESSKVESNRMPDCEGARTSFTELAGAESVSLEKISKLSSDSTNRVQKTIGPYQLLRKLGEGGMGEVWMAEQKQPVRRRVALKLIKKGMDNQQVIARFEVEKQALAMMDHQNIAKVLDAGTTDDGQPYFVMEFVQGTPLTKYCDDNKLSIEQRLRLFIDVCAGVQHAHQKGIIHRDLKPGNVLVGVQDDRPIPKVIDFGLAKAIESTQRLSDQSLFTGMGQILGTLKYMSPEQASLDNLDIDTRTDIYALGVMLYELLTGCTPLDDASIKGQAALRVLEFIREKDPVKPSSKFSNSTNEEISTITGQRQTDSGQLNRVLTRDLDWIVMKALEKDRVRRYESASGFAADVNRFLNNEPVIARPPTWSYSARKFVRKNRIGVIAASLVAVTLIGGVVATSLAMFRAQQSERDAVAARENEATQRKEAELSRALAESRRQEAEKNLAFARKGNEILGSIFADLNPEAQYNEVSELRDALRSNLSHALEDLQGTAIGDPLDVVQMQFILGQSLSGLGEPHLAVEVFEQTLDTTKSMLGPDHPETIRSMSELGANYLSAGKLDLAVTLLEDALARSRLKNGLDHVDTISNMNNLGMTYRKLERMDEAVALFQEVLKLNQAKYGIDSVETLSVVSNLASCYVETEWFDKAMPLLERSLAIRKVKLGPDHPDTLKSLNNLAMTHLKTGDLAKALPLLKELLELRRSRLGPEHPDTVSAMSNLARVYSKLDQPDEARVLYEESLKLRQAKLGADHPETLVSMSNLAAIYLDLGMIQEAEPLLQVAFSRAKTKLGENHSITLACMNNLFRTYRKSNQLDKGLPILEQALSLRKAKLGINHTDTVATMDSLAGVYDSLGKHEQALPLLEQLFEISKAKQGSDHPDTLRAINKLASCCLAAGQLEKGFSLYEQALEIKKAKYGPDHKRTIDGLTQLGWYHLKAGQPGKAIPWLKQALSLKETKYRFDDARTLRSMARLATAYMANIEVDKALPLFERVFGLRKDTLGAEHPDTLEAMNGLMDAYAKAGLTQKCLGLVEESISHWRESCPESSPELAEQLSAAGLKLLQLKQFSQAEKLLRESLTIRQATQPDEWTTFDNQSNLGAALLGQAMSVVDVTEKATLLAEAEKMLLAGYEGLKQREAAVPTAGATRIPIALDQLIKIYTVLDKPDEIKKYRELRAEHWKAKK